MTHLTSNDVIDALDGSLDNARRAHLESCAACRAEVEGRASVLREVTRGGKPEPSPLYWDQLSARVRQAVARVEPERNSPWRQSLWDWRVMTPVVGAALVVFAFIFTPARQTARPPSHAMNTRGVGVELVASADAGWSVVADLVASMDWDDAAAAGLSPLPGAAEQALVDLNDDERAELHRLLEAELKRPRS